MSVTIGIIIGIIVLIILWIAFMYNSLVRGRNHCTESWSNVDTELKRRYDLIPNLVETVKGYAKHEREVLERVTQARAAAAASHGSPASQARDENTFGAGYFEEAINLVNGILDRLPESLIQEMKTAM